MCNPRKEMLCVPLKPGLTLGVPLNNNGTSVEPCNTPVLICFPGLR